MNIPGMPPLDIKQTIWQDLDQFQKFMSEFHQSLTDPEQKQALGQMLEQLQKARTEAQELAPQVVQNLQQEATQAKAGAEALMKEAEQARQEVEQLEKDLAEAKRKFEETGMQVPEMPLAPQPVADPHRGVVLGKELLAALGTGAAAVAAGTAVEDLGSIAEAWVEPNQDLGQSRSEQPKPEPAPVTKPKPQQQPPKKKKEPGPEKPDDDIWEGLSRLED